MCEHEFRANLLTGLVVGAGMGVLAALLLAPMSGKRLRRDLARKGHVAAHRASEAAEAVRDRGLDVYERAREMVG